MERTPVPIELQLRRVPEPVLMRWRMEEYLPCYQSKIQRMWLVTHLYPLSCCKNHPQFSQAAQFVAFII
jgi:hypothetical protein